MDNDDVNIWALIKKPEAGLSLTVLRDDTAVLGIKHGN